MPLIAAACIAYTAGLVAGFTGYTVPALAAAALAGLLAWMRGVPHRVALAALGIAGTLIAADIKSDDRRCRALAATGSGEWQATVVQPLAPDEAGRVLLRITPGCALRATAIVDSGSADAGERVLIAGRLTVGGGVNATAPLRLDRAQINVLAAAPPLPRWRAHVGRTIDRVFGEDAPLAAALLIADTQEIPPEIRDRFAVSGLIHVLSISGLHVAIIAGAVELLALAARLPRRSALLAAIAVTTGYVLLLGAPPPALRSGVMLGVTAASRLMQRPTSRWASLAVGAGASLVLDPRTVMNLGWQLSVAGVAALLAASALSRRWVAPHTRGWRASLLRAFLASVAASLVTAPLVTWHFGQLSLVSPLTNLLAGPVVALMQPALFLALVLAPIPAAAGIAADGAHVLLRLLDLIAITGAAVPMASVAVMPSATGAVLCAVAAVCAVVACVSRFPARALIGATFCMAMMMWLPLTRMEARGVELHMIDVGQGDALALRTPRGRWVIFDAGRVWPGGDAGRRNVVPYVRRRGGQTVAFVLSHPDADHVGGATSVLRALRPAEYWDAAYAGGSESYRESLRDAARLGIRWRRARPGDSLAVDGVIVRFLAPDSAWMAGLGDANESSAIALIRYGSVRFLLMGDAESVAEEWLLRHARDSLHADVLKVGHHGSRTSSSPAFLAAVRPRVALISVGAGNIYRHPSSAVIGALTDAGAQVLRTDQLGSVVVHTDGSSITLEADEERWVLSRN